MIQNIVFDMGQVLIHWYPEMYTGGFGLTEEEQALLVRELFQSVEWVQLDRGTISEEKAVEQVCARLPEQFHTAVEEIVTGWWKRPLFPVEGMEELIRELKKKGYGLYVLSNAGVSLRSYFHRIPCAEYFDGVMISAEEKLIKPQHEIYEALFRRFDLSPESCFFVDDNPANIEGAKCCGMEGTIFRGDVPKLRRELTAAGIQ